MRRKKQGGKAKKKVTFVTRKQLRHTSCPLEDFEAVLEEQCTRTEAETEPETEPDGEVTPPPTTAPAGTTAAAVEAAAAAAEAESGRRGCRPSDAITSATSRTLLAVPAVAAVAPTSGQRAAARPQVRKSEQRILLTQCRPLVDSVDNKAVVEQMMKRLSDLLRMLHPPAAEGAYTAPEEAAAAAAAAMAAAAAEATAAEAAAVAASAAAAAQPGDAAKVVKIPSKYYRLLRQLAARNYCRRRSRSRHRGDEQLPQSDESPTAAATTVLSEWEKKLIYEK